MSALCIGKHHSDGTHTRPRSLALLRLSPELWGDVARRRPTASTACGGSPERSGTISPETKRIA